MMDQHMPDDGSGLGPPGASYAFYGSDDSAGEQSYALYNPAMQYQQPTHPRQMPTTDMYRLHSINNMMPNTQQQYAPAYPTAPHGMSISASPVPGESPQMYGEPLSPPISGGSDSGADAIYNSRSGTGSPSSSRGNSLVNHHHHRNPIRYNPTPSPSGSSGRRRGRSESDEDMGVSLAESIAHTRKEATRRQRIEAEQRRRDDLRDGYARLKDVLPVSNQKNSKVSLLERATHHIIQLDKMNQQLQARLAAVEQEVARLRSLNEKISLGPGNTPSPMASTPHNIEQAPVAVHNLVPVGGHNLTREDSSSSPSDGGI